MTPAPPDAVPLVDAHLHVWDPRRLSYPWLADLPEINGPHLPSDVVTTADPRFVVVQAGVPGEGYAEAQWVQDLARGRFPQIAGIVALALVERGVRVRDELERLTGIPRVVGIRRLLQDEPTELFTHPDMRAGLEEVRAAGLTFDACIRWWQLPALVDLVRAVPGLPVVLDHLGKPPVTGPIDSPDGQAWLAGLTAFAALPDTFVKLSGLPAEVSGAGAPVATLVPWIRAAADVFGPERAMVGSDWPVSRAGALGLTYDGWITLVRDTVAGSAAEVERVLGGTASAFYRLDQVAPSG